MVDLSQFKEGIRAAINSYPQICTDPRGDALSIVQAMGAKATHIIPDILQRVKGERCKGAEKDFFYIYREFDDTQNENHMIGWMQYGYWKDGTEFHWSSRSENIMSQAERISHRAAVDQAKVQYDIEKEVRHSEAAKVAFSIWSDAKEAVNHPYLDKKGVGACKGLKIAKDGRLIVPIAINNEIVSLQYINDDSEKRFLTGGRLKGGWFMIEGETDVVYIAEGYSTARSVAEATGKTVYISFNAGNIYEVAVYVKANHPNTRIIISGDDDTETVGNAGRTKAEQASDGLGIEVIFPQGFVDFNDMHHELGIDALKEYINPENMQAYDGEDQTANDNIERPTGVLGDIYDYYNATSGNTQHGFATQAALAIVSIITARSYRTNLDNYTSLYFLCVGRTGTGKEHIKTTIENILDAAEMGHYIAGDGYTSAGAVYSTLLDRPKHLPIVDEIGRYLEASRKGSGGQNQREANTKLMEAFGRCHGVMRPLNYSTMTLKKADADHIKNRLIHNPSITFMGMTTPDTLFQSLDIDAVKDGFINRFCIYISDAEISKRKNKEPLPVPQSIIDWITAVHNRSNKSHVATQKAMTIDIPFTQGALDVISDFEDWCIDKARGLEKYGMSGLTMRGAEIVMRMSLGHGLSRDPFTEYIDENDAIWCIKFKKAMLKRIIKTLKITVSTSDFEAHKKEILANLRGRKDKGITWSAMQKTPPYSQHKPKDLREILEALKDADLAGNENIVTGSKGRPSIKWIALK